MTSQIRPIPGYTYLFARADGKILRQWHGQLLVRKTRLVKDDEYVRIKYKRTVFERAVSRLVLSAFAGPCPPNHKAVHLDHDRLNNRLDNLAWNPIRIRAEGAAKGNKSTKVNQTAKRRGKRA